MSMQSYLRKASKKLVEDTEAVEEPSNETAPAPKDNQPKAKSASKSTGGSMHSAPAHMKKGTRKKI